MLIDRRPVYAFSQSDASGGVSTKKNKALHEPFSDALKISSVEVRSLNERVILHGIPSVEQALRSLYSTQPAADGGKTTNDLIEGPFIGEHRVLGQIITSPMSDKERAKAIERILRDGRSEMERTGRWEGNYGFDNRYLGGGYSPADIRIFINRVLSDDFETYLLGIGYGDRGDIEQRLAEQIGAEQGLREKSVRVELEPEEGNRFRIDFDAIAQRLQPLYAELNPESAPLTGDEILDTVLEQPHDRESKVFVLGAKEGIEVAFEFGLAVLRSRNGGDKLGLWQREEAVLSGQLFEDFNVSGEFYPADFAIKVYREGKRPGDYPFVPLAITDEMKAQMDNLANRAASAFR